MKVLPKVCAVCWQVLDRYQGQWIHSAELLGKSDHLCIPVDYDDERVRSMCDFCYAEVSKADLWALPADDFRVPLINSRSIGAWACCPDCAALLSSGDWSGVSERALTAPLLGVTDDTRESMLNWLTLLGKALLEHATGPVRKWEPGDEEMTV